MSKPRMRPANIVLACIVVALVFLLATPSLRSWLLARWEAFAYVDESFATQQYLDRDSNSFVVIKGKHDLGEVYTVKKKRFAWVPGPRGKLVRLSPERAHGASIMGNRSTPDNRAPSPHP